MTKIFGVLVKSTACRMSHDILTLGSISHAGKVLHNMRAEKFTQAEMLQAIEQGHTPSGAAQWLTVNLRPCHPDTVRNYAKRYPSLKTALNTERLNMVDIAETGLRAALERSEAWAIAFALKTLAKDIYSERQEMTGKDGESLSITTRIVRRDTQ